MLYSYMIGAGHVAEPTPTLQAEPSRSPGVEPVDGDAFMRKDADLAQGRPQHFTNLGELVAAAAAVVRAELCRRLGVASSTGEGATNA